MSFLRRRQREAEPFPDSWRELISRRLAAWPTLDATERGRLEQLVHGLVTGFRWEAANGFEITEEVQVTVAASAALLVLGDGFDLDCYRHVTSIVVHASTIFVRGEQHTGLPGGLMFDGTTMLAGQTHFRGPVFLAWDSVRRDLRHPHAGRNVVLHEFAHALDMLDGTVDGTPPLGPDALARWAAVCEDELAALRAGADESGLLDDYAATDPGEFFAVVTEVFFTRALALRDLKPALYQVFTDFYRQDPAARSAALSPGTP